MDQSGNAEARRKAGIDLRVAVRAYANKPTDERAAAVTAALMQKRRLVARSAVHELKMRLEALREGR